MALLRVSERLPKSRPWKALLNDMATKSGEPGLAFFMHELICGEGCV